MPVYRHGISADMLGAEHRLDKGDSIGEKDRDAAAGANARRGEQARGARSEEHTSELQSLMRYSYAVFFLRKKNPRANFRTLVIQQNTWYYVYYHTKQRISQQYID